MERRLPGEAYATVPLREPGEKGSSGVAGAGAMWYKPTHQSTFFAESEPASPARRNTGLSLVSSSEFSVEIDHDSKLFGDFVAVDDVSLSVPAAGLVVLGRVGKMLTYAALVLGCATCQWVLVRGWRG